MTLLQAFAVPLIFNVFLVSSVNAGSYGHRIPIIRDILSSTKMSPEVRYGYKMVFAYCIQIPDDNRSRDCAKTAIKTTSNALDAQVKARAIVNGGLKADKQYRINMEAMKDIK